MNRANSAGVPPTPMAESAASFSVVVGWRIAVAAAAHLCLRFGTTPRGLYEEHLDDLQQLTEQLTACDHENVAFP